MSKHVIEVNKEEIVFKFFNQIVNKRTLVQFIFCNPQVDARPAGAAALMSCTANVVPRLSILRWPVARADPPVTSLVPASIHAVTKFCITVTMMQRVHPAVFSHKSGATVSTNCARLCLVTSMTFPVVYRATSPYHVVGTSVYKCATRALVRNLDRCAHSLVRYLGNSVVIYVPRPATRANALMYLARKWSR